MEKTNDENSIYKFHASRLNFVLPEDFTIKEANNPKVICLAQNKAGVLFQVACDGKLQINETFEERMNKVIEKTVDYMKQSKYSHPDKNYYFVRDYSNGTFDFKIYAQDLVTNGRAVKMLNAFFLDGEYQEFYQLSLSVGPFPFPTKILKVGVFSPATDQIANLLSSYLEKILSDLKYK